MTSKDRLAYTIPELVEASGLGRTTIYGEIRDGRLRVIKVRRRTLVRAEDARAWLAALTRETGEAA
ncbi:helix-turn-helix transcriptional regulator [Ferruginivarius sediminum]|uniref:DNA-binding protein n=1 Tax=Ferruginivarius sediminum TaxID=2661937 RepID=A0A369TF00_9PROT|nr:helix-turn-helix domain-containing protein [Ferruginivarius sediminum]RDD63830.1 DNA-binding protein [Ferruginivarius sediminum]